MLAGLFCLASVVPALADEIVIAIGQSLPPYVMGDTKSGLEVDIIRESLQRVGHTANFRFSPNLNAAGVMASGHIDGVAVNTSYDVGKAVGKTLFNSSPTISFQNFAITLKSYVGTIGSIGDLQNERIIAFLNAEKLLGEHFKRMAKSNGGYTEHSNQLVQPKMLLANRVDVAIADKRIFTYWAQQSDINVEENFFFHSIFPLSPRGVTFHNKSYRDDLNRGLTELRKSGGYKKILAKYRSQ